MKSEKIRAGDKLSVRMSVEDRQRLTNCVRELYGDGASFESQLIRDLVRAFCDYVETGRDFSIRLPVRVKISVTPENAAPNPVLSAHAVAVKIAENLKSKL